MDDIPVVTDEHDVPTGDVYAYHVTRREYVDSIRATGIRPQDRGPDGSRVDELLQQYKPDKGTPRHRSHCVFLHPTRDRVHAVGGEEWNGNMTVVVDLRKVGAPMYTADHELATQVFGASAENEADVARQYWDSCRPYTPGEAHESELLIEGGVSPYTIECIFDHHSDE